MGRGAISLVALSTLLLGATRWEIDPAMSLRLENARAFMTTAAAPRRLVRAFEMNPSALLGPHDKWLPFVEKARKTGPTKGKLAESRTEQVIEAVYDRLRILGELHLSLDREVVTVVVKRKRVIFEWPGGARLAYDVRSMPGRKSLWYRKRGRPGRLPWYMVAERRGGRIDVETVTGDRMVLRKLKPARRTGRLNDRQRRLRALEVQPVLRRMYDGAVALWRKEKRIPESAGPVPARRPTCKRKRPVPYTPDKDTWTGPGWEAMRMRTGGPLFFQYEFVASGVGEGPRFSARATGDLDCDGVLSTYEYTGIVGPDGRVDARGGLKRVRPLE